MLARRPFQPVGSCIHGQAFEIRHPEMALLCFFFYRATGILIGYRLGGLMGCRRHLRLFRCNVFDEPMTNQAA